MKNFYSIARWKREILAQVLIFIMTMMVLSNAWWVWWFLAPVLVACVWISSNVRYNQLYGKKER